MAFTLRGRRHRVNPLTRNQSPRSWSCGCLSRAIAPKIARGERPAALPPRKQNRRVVGDGCFPASDTPLTHHSWAPPHPHGAHLADLGVVVGIERFEPDERATTTPRSREGERERGSAVSGRLWRRGPPTRE